MFFASWKKVVSCLCLNPNSDSNSEFSWNFKCADIRNCYISLVTHRIESFFYCSGRPGRILKIHLILTILFGRWGTLNTTNSLLREYWISFGFVLFRLRFIFIFFSIFVRFFFSFCSNRLFTIYLLFVYS